MDQKVIDQIHLCLNELQMIQQMIDLKFAVGSRHYYSQRLRSEKVDIKHAVDGIELYNLKKSFAFCWFIMVFSKDFSIIM